MNTQKKNYRVAVILNTPVSVANFHVLLNDTKWDVLITADLTNVSDKYFDLVITNNAIDEIKKYPIQVLENHGTTIYLSDKTNPVVQEELEGIFKNSIVKTPNKDFNTPVHIKALINSELVKHNSKSFRLPAVSFLFNRHTYKEIWRKVFFELWLLLVPFVIIVGYLLYRIFNNNPQFTLMCYFRPFDADCLFDLNEELLVLTIFYSIFNLLYYFNYILKTINNDNPSIYSSVTEKIKKSIMLYLIPILFFLSALIILKTLFVFTHQFKIASQYNIADIGKIIDTYLPILNNTNLLWIFTILDILILIFVKHHLSILKKSNYKRFIPKSQQSFIISAKKSFLISVIWDLIIIGLSFTFFKLIGSESAVLILQLAILQFGYLMINIQSYLSDFKYE
jgi:hypothetical protein